MLPTRTSAVESERDAALGERLDARVRAERGGAGVGGVIGERRGRTPEGHDAVAEVLVHGAELRRDDAAHVLEVLAEHRHELLRRARLGE
jgi:hypothetical protein